ncbi:hypothetical protein [Aeromicrobium sp. UC242_57]|uniref:hypothetical protein n=1 Tax=Aeromicrobium sp. UC242_57 TaxID=3374624 RepID=UPI00378C39F9
MRTITHLLVGGLATTAILTGTAVTATAQSDKITDKRADVVQYDDFEEDEAGTILDRADSLASGIEATSATVKHSKKSIKVTIRFADLTRQEVQAGAVVRVKGSKQPRYLISSISRKKVAVYDLKGDEMKQLCTGKQTKKAGKKGTITFSVKRTCLKKPKAIKVQTGVSRFINFDNESFTIYQEVISSSRVRTPESTKWLKAS